MGKYLIEKPVLILIEKPVLIHRLSFKPDISVNFNKLRKMGSHLLESHL
jgi:hypothetical protein